MLLGYIFSKTPIFGGSAAKDPWHYNVHYVGLKSFLSFYRTF